MDIITDTQTKKEALSFYGGPLVALLPFILFITGVIYIALSGAPDEKGFWPVLILALGVGLLLVRNKKRYSEVVLEGMSQPIVMIMITAWILASIIGVLMAKTGFIEALTWLASTIQLGPAGFVLAAFVICCIVSLSTGSSFATILICTPLLYPAGGSLGGHLPTLAGAILAGATFGDFFAPISDTTIASALSQKAEIGPTVKSRIKYILPATIFALICIAISSNINSSHSAEIIGHLEGSPVGLPMLIVPVVIIYLFIKGAHLFHGLMAGLILGTILGLILKLLPMQEIISLDLDNMVAQSFVITGINRSIGLSIFTILLMGLVQVLKSSGIFESILSFTKKRISKAWHAESWIGGMSALAVLLTTHSIVAILMVADFCRDTGKDHQTGPVRRANIMSIVVCVFPFILPYFIPVILMASMTNSENEFGIPSVSPLDVGMHNFLAIGLLLVIFPIIFLGYGRRADNKIK